MKLDYKVPKLYDPQKNISLAWWLPWHWPVKLHQESGSVKQTKSEATKPLDHSYQCLPPISLHFLKHLKPSQAAPSVGIEVFKHMSPWGHCTFQTTTLPKLEILCNVSWDVYVVQVLISSVQNQVTGVLSPWVYESHVSVWLFWWVYCTCTLTGSVYHCQKITQRLCQQMQIVLLSVPKAWEELCWTS